MDEIIRPNPVSGYLELTVADIGKKVAFGTQIYEDPDIGKERLWDTGCKHEKKDMIWLVLDVFDDALRGTTALLLSQTSPYEKDNGAMSYNRKDYYEILENFWKNFCEKVFSSAEREIIHSEDLYYQCGTLSKGDVARYKDLIFSRNNIYNGAYKCLRLLMFNDVSRIYGETVYGSGYVEKEVDTGYYRGGNCTCFGIQHAIKIACTKEGREKLKAYRERVMQDAIEHRKREEERKNKQAHLRKKGVCQYCGGKFGLLKKVCKDCGRRKDY